MRNCSNGLIYKITNTVNNKIYVGKLNDKENFDKYWGSGILIGRAIKKYGLSNFKKEILERVINGDLNDREKFWIRTLNSFDIRIGYNLTAGGDGGDVFTKKPKYLQDITRKRTSKAHKGKKQNSEWIRKRISKIKGKGNGMFGKKLSSDTLQKISKKLKGRIFTQEHRENMRYSKFGDKNPVHAVLSDPERCKRFKERVSEATKGGKNPRAIMVDKLDLKGNIIESFYCLKDASISVIGKYTIYCSQKIKKAAISGTELYGYLWRTPIS